MLLTFLVLRDRQLIPKPPSRKNPEVFKKYIDRYGPNNVRKSNISSSVAAKPEKSSILGVISILLLTFHIVRDIMMISLPFKRSSSELLKKYNDHGSESPLQKVNISEKSLQIMKIESVHTLRQL